MCRLLILHLVKLDKLYSAVRNSMTARDPGSKECNNVLFALCMGDILIADAFQTMNIC